MHTARFSVFRLTLALLLAAATWPALAVEEGEQAPDFTLPRLDSQESRLQLSELRGSVVYVDFWASWCTPCLQSLPAVNELYQEYHERGFEVVAVTVDREIPAARQFLEDLEVPLDYRVVSDVENAVMHEYGVRGMPTSFLIDRDGVVRDVHEGFRDGDIERLEQALQPLL